LWLRNGDRVEGNLLAVNAKEARIKSSAGKEVRIEREKIAVLAMNTELARLPRPRGAYGRLVLANGCRLGLASADTDKEFVLGKTLFGTAVKIPLGQLIALTIYQGRAAYLSDLKPRRYEHTPYLGLRWPYTLDASVAGYDLRLAGSTYDKGIGLHSESRLTYDLTSNFQWFEAVVGLDEHSGREGGAVIEVLVDGKSQNLGEAGELTLQDGPRSVRVKLAGAKELTLVVKFGRRGDVQDHVDWVDARIIK
jgi:hypothetical protein